MSIWLIISSITVVTVFILIFPLIFFDFKKKNFKNEYEYDINIYKDQLNEIEKDIYRGVLSKEEFESAKYEVSRRILSQKNTNQIGENDSKNNANKYKLLSVTFLSLLIPIISLNLYYLLGNPSIPNQPFVKNLSKINNIAQNNNTVSSIEDSIIQLKKRLAQNENDRDGWLLLGRSYLVILKPNEAIQAFKKIIELDPSYKEVYSFIGEALVFREQGIVTDEAINNFKIALEYDKKNPASRYYLSLAKSQRGNINIAFREWLELAKETPPNTPWYPLLQSQIEDAAIKLGVNLQDIKNSNQNKNSVGPTQEDIKAAQEMPPEDRKEMIKGMVNNLAEKLKDNPNDIDGWKMLARSYRVLGDNKKAEEAEKIIKKLENN